MIENLNTIDNRTMMKRVGLIAGPIALQSLIASSLNLIDNLMIGGLGELALNAVGVSAQMFFVFWMLVFGFTSGNATFMAQFFGANDYANIRRTTGFALTVNFCMGCLFFLVAFFLPEHVLKDYDGNIESHDAYTNYNIKSNYGTKAAAGLVQDNASSGGVA